MAHPYPVRNYESAAMERGSVVATEIQRSVETETDGGGSRLAPVGDVQLDEDVGDVGAHGAGTEEERLRDLLVGLVPRQQAQHVELARRETGRALRRTGLLSGGECLA